MKNKIIKIVKYGENGYLASYYDSQGNLQKNHFFNANNINDVKQKLKLIFIYDSKYLGKIGGKIKIIKSGKKFVRFVENNAEKKICKICAGMVPLKSRHCSCEYNFYSNSAPKRPDVLLQANTY